MKSKTDDDDIQGIFEQIFAATAGNVTKGTHIT